MIPLIKGQLPSLLKKKKGQCQDELQRAFSDWHTYVDTPVGQKLLLVVKWFLGFSFECGTSVPLSLRELAP